MRIRKGSFRIGLAAQSAAQKHIGCIDADFQDASDCEGELTENTSPQADVEVPHGYDATSVDTGLGGSENLQPN